MLVAVMGPFTTTPEDAEHFRREAMGAFAHEVRTPLTSIKMVMELARRQSSHGELLLDTELAEMLKSSVEDLQQLADDLQEASRLERGKVALSTGPCEIATALDAARELAGNISLAGIPEPGLEGPWDAARLVRAIAGFAVSANRIGDGSGTVQVEAVRKGQTADLTFTSGVPAGSEKPIAADAGFSFFRSRQLVLAMGGSVHCRRAERFATIRVALPLGSGGEVR
ncbi:MAG: HAMP domain-containing histidine kinase [Dehalococcoidia bacterium]|uniref:sensor histidine kinase n=1 Tax=Candidatus Amarobacter glycogenicus TaxID=3140699 RepID=UPI001DE5BD56|nr:HAMP domain-containing histidine kinase [Dehalococcoidia bacterium]MBK7126126.1 HAMP domain-containing histidine kinase [Dehalococcoidia bacterium]MBK7725585.1 HAMP domain-containing histidine kinase [Dehalococcoidia bacterium]MBK9341999.1 HAMP domain-containing histidine kinase [Dehalococcoidia bacterium]MBK9612776.1 HAMP domain-containing histidine kinase [Dehalococcoidia bacterium]